MAVTKQVALFQHCLEDDALEAYNTFTLGPGSTLQDIIENFDNFVIGEMKETY